jgi:sugar lactone lactonase YvrE
MLLASSYTHAQLIYTNPYTFTTLAGNVGVGYGSADGTGSAARFAFPARLAADAAGNLYVADMLNFTIRKITPEGLVTTLAGLAECPGAEDGTGSTARFCRPLGLAVDTAGILYVADSVAHTIRKITPVGTNWVVTTLAGLAGSAGSADGAGKAARFNVPNGITVDHGGNLYVADSWNNTIRKVTPEGVVTTLAGLAGSAGSLDDTGSSARFNGPMDVAVDTAGYLYVADQGNCTIRKVTPEGVVTTLAGLAGSAGSQDGTGRVARFDTPSGVGVDASGNVYVADRWNHTIRKVTPQGVVTTLAGLAGNAGTNNGTGNAARFAFPSDVVPDGAGNLYVADRANNTIRKLTSTGASWRVTTLAGLAVGNVGSADGKGREARFCGPQSVAVDASGNLYVSEWDNHTIRKITPAGDVTTLAGRAGIPGGTDGPGSAARFNCPCGVAVDDAGNVYVADMDNHTIRKLTPLGIVTTLAGSVGVPGSIDGKGSAARFNCPAGVAVDTNGNVYVAEYGNHTIRKMTPAGVVTTLAGRAGYVGSTDGTNSAARFNVPYGVAVDLAGNVYVAENGNFTIRKVTPAGVVTTLAGLAGHAEFKDGTGETARFACPVFVAVDGNNDLYVTDSLLLRKVTATGVVTTLAGDSRLSGYRDGTGRSAMFVNAHGVAVDSTGNVYVTDYYQVECFGNTIRKGYPAGSVPPPMLASRGVNPSQFGFGIMGLPAVWVNIESSSDLANWHLVGTRLLESGTNSFLSPGATRGAEFYRCYVR